MQINSLKDLYLVSSFTLERIMVHIELVDDEQVLIVNLKCKPSSSIHFPKVFVVGGVHDVTRRFHLASDQSRDALFLFFQGFEARWCWHHLCHLMLFAPFVSFDGLCAI